VFLTADMMHIELLTIPAGVIILTLGRKLFWLFRVKPDRHGRMANRTDVLAPCPYRRGHRGAGGISFFRLGPDHSLRINRCCGYNGKLETGRISANHSVDGVVYFRCFDSNRSHANRSIKIVTEKDSGYGIIWC